MTTIHALVATTEGGTADVELFSTQEAAAERLADALVEHALDGGHWHELSDAYGHRWVETNDEDGWEPTGRTMQLQSVEVDATR
jgi:hypothetical protein